MKPIASMAVVATLLTIGMLSTPTLAQTKLTFLYNASGDFVGSYVAADQGFFTRHGLEVSLSLAQSGAAALPALVSDSAQIAGPTPPSMLQADEQGLDLVVVASTHLFPLPPGVGGALARTGSGIKDAGDLRGRKVGVPGFGGTVDLLAKTWVQSSGLDYHQVGWIELQLPQMGDAMKTGLADAVMTVNPFYARDRDNKVGYDIGSYFSIVPSGAVASIYVSTRNWATKNAATVKAFRAALDDATAYINDTAHADSVRASLAKFSKLPPQAAATIDIPVNLDAHAKPSDMDFWIKISREQGLVKGNPDSASLIAP